MSDVTPPRAIVVPGLGWRRLLYATLVLGSTTLGGLGMLAIVSAGGVTVLEVTLLALFVPTFGWITTSFWNAVIGFVLGALGVDPLSLRRGREVPADTPIRSKTALVMPAHNEEPGLVVSGQAAVTASLERTGLGEHFDLHLLSDTTDPGTCPTWLRRRARSQPGARYVTSRRIPTDSTTADAPRTSVGRPATSPSSASGARTTTTSSWCSTRTA